MKQVLRSSGSEEWIVGALDKGDGNAMGEYQTVSKCKLRPSMALWLPPIKDHLNHNSVAAAAISQEAPLSFAVIHTHAPTVCSYRVTHLELLLTI